MRYTAWEEFWWNSITGARTVVDRVAMALLENKMVVLKVPSDLPWRYPMRSAIQNAFNERTDARDIVIETIDAVIRSPAASSSRPTRPRPSGRATAKNPGSASRTTFPTGMSSKTASSG